MTCWNLYINIRQLNSKEKISKSFWSSQLSFLGMFLFTEFGFKSLAICNGRYGLYKLSTRSKCSSLLTSSRRLLQKNAAFVILLCFFVAVDLRTWIIVEAPLNDFTLRRNSWYIPTYYNKQKASDDSSLYRSEGSIRLAPSVL